VARLLRQHGLHARKRLGQNFLQDQRALEGIAAIARLSPSETVLEIGPGLGSLTRYLAAAAQKVIAVELDERLFPVLQEVVSPYDNIQLLYGDILEFNPGEFIEEPDYVVVANIPYYITSAVIRHLLENDPKPDRLVLTVQKEVAQRICASPGKMSLLALSVQVFGRPEIAAKIPSRAFYPAPAVDSAVLQVEIYPSPLIASPHLGGFFRLSKAGFSQKRKMLRNALAAGMRRPPTEIEGILREAGIDPRRRAETLDLGEWGSLSEVFNKSSP
jgi:16S rRNA (adenine1518-N6/adenine1519-N6)-dimethyltransferase